MKTPDILKKRRERGFFLVEALVAMLLFAVLAMGVANSMVFFMHNRMRAIHRSAATQIASDLLEHYAGIDSALLSSANSFTDIITWQGSRMRFQRNLVVEVNGDGSRTIRASVTDLNSRIGGTTTVSTILAPLG